MGRLAAFLICLGLLGTAHLAQAQGPGQGSGMILYGNWCGPGTDMNGPPPIDPLDDACMRHDICYTTHGLGTCTCDVAFMRELRAMAYPNQDLFLRSRAMYDALAMTPCDDPAGWALKQSLMWSDIADDALSGRATPMEVPARWMYLFSRSNPYY